MSIQLSDKVSITATALVLLLDNFGEELIEKIQSGEITDTDQILPFARDKAVDYIKNSNNKES